VVLEETVLVGVDVDQQHPEGLLCIIAAAHRWQGTGLELEQKGMGEYLTTRRAPRCIEDLDAGLLWGVDGVASNVSHQQRPTTDQPCCFVLSMHSLCARHTNNSPCLQHLCCPCSYTGRSPPAR
jgi:hypothetical protein